MSDQVPKEPSTVTFLPTLYCSRRCVYCNVKTSPQPEDDAIPLKRLEKVFGELRGLGVEVVRMSGGDPFARKDLFDVIAIAIEEDLVPDLPAKLGLSYYEVLRLQNLGVRSVQVDLDSADPTIADRMAGLKGYHARVFRVLDSLRRAGLSVRIKTVLTPLNAPTVGRLLDFLATLGNVASVTFQSVSGKSHTLEYKDALTNGNWTTILPAVTGNGSPMTLIDGSATNTMRFYRVHMQ